MVVTIKIFGHFLQALIDSSATRCFFSSSVVVPLGLSLTKDYTFLELGDGQKVLSKCKVVDIPIVTIDIIVRLDLTITSLFHNVDVILGINWLQVVNSLIDLSSSRILLPKEAGTSMLPSD